MKLELEVGEGQPGGAESDVTAARRFRSPVPERMTSPSVGLELGLLQPQGAHDRAAPASESASTSVSPAPGTMATDSWALAVDEQEAAAESLSNLHLKEEKIKPDANGAVVKTNANAEKADEEEKEDRAAQSLLNKLIRSNLVDNTNQVEVLQRDPNSPLYSVKSFEELRLKPQLLQGVYAMGFNRPSKIQENALPLMLAEPPQNLIAQSQSGTGKTAAFVLAMLSQVEPAHRYPQCLCLSPTYELALQTGKVIEQMGKFYPELKLAYAVRGNKLERGQKISEHIVIGTPGTVLDWCAKLKFIDPKKIKVFVLDEADVMIATQGHQDQSIRIQRMLPRNCQMLLFSATFEDSVWKFAQKVVPDPNIIKLKREEETLDTIKQYYVLCNNRDEKFQALCNLYGAITIAQAMIFCHTRKTASWLAAELSKEGHQVALLSGEMMVEQRAAVIERFREGKEKVLVTTNVCARGEQRTRLSARPRVAREVLLYGAPLVWGSPCGVGADILFRERLDSPGR
uniref:RNA helicase n=1 Tax=Ailuropoda melanoleuca TaxID=9646 RepID=A0A7N5KB01_AILME